MQIRLNISDILKMIMARRRGSYQTGDMRLS